MLDPNLNKISKETLSTKFENNGKVQKVVRNSCRNIVGLYMDAELVDGMYKAPYAFFSAAKIAGFNKLLIEVNEVNGKYKWFDVDEIVAKKCYKGENGNIDKTNARNKDWWFCKENDASSNIPPSRNTPSCQCAPCSIM